MQISESKQTIVIRASCFILGLIASVASGMGFLWVVVVLSRYITRWEFTYLSLWPLAFLCIAVLMFRRALQNRCGELPAPEKPGGPQGKADKNRANSVGPESGRPQLRREQ